MTLAVTPLRITPGSIVNMAAGVVASIVASVVFSVVISIIVNAGVHNSAQADEGMWMARQLPQIAPQLKAAGLKLAPEALTQLTAFPMGAIVSLGGCSASFVSPQGLVVTNHHCVYDSVAYNSTPQSDLLANGFLAQTRADELPAAPGSRIFVTVDVSDVSAKVITPTIAQLRGKERSAAIEQQQKDLIAACEQDADHRCTVPAFYGGLEYHLIKQLEIRDVRLVHVPASGIGKFGGDTDNWMWPRHTGDYGFYRAYVSANGKAADFSRDNVPYVPQHFLTLAKDGLSDGDFVMALGYPGRTNRHRLPSEVAHAFEWSYPAFVKLSAERIAIIERETRGNADTTLSYASQLAGISNYYKNRQGMIASYAGSDFLKRKTQEHAALTAWVAADPVRKAQYAADIVQVEQLIAERDRDARREFFLASAAPRLLNSARSLLRLAHESEKPDADRKAGYQLRDLPRFKAGIAGIERNYDQQVDQALVLNSLIQYAAQSADLRSASFDAALGIKAGASASDLKTVLTQLYASSKLGDKVARAAWLGKKPADFRASNDGFVQAAVALYDGDLANEAKEEALGGKLQQAYANYMLAKIAYMTSRDLDVYPDANGTLRVTYGHVQGRAHGVDGTAWKPFTTVAGVLAKHTGSGDFNAPAAQLAAIKARGISGGKYIDPVLKTVPVDFLATLDITGGNSGSAVLNAHGELVGLAFDGTLDSIISDWDYNETNTRSIQVDLRYMLWNMTYVDKADRLLREMGAE
jgi:hypothetical protein